MDRDLGRKSVADEISDIERTFLPGEAIAIDGADPGHMGYGNNRYVIQTLDIASKYAKPIFAPKKVRVPNSLHTRVIFPVDLSCPRITLNTPTRTTQALFACSPNIE